MISNTKQVRQHFTSALCTHLFSLFPNSDGDCNINCISLSTSAAGATKCFQHSCLYFIIYY